MAFLFILFVCSGCLLAALSIPLIMGKIGPNPWYGFRVKCTLSDPVVWYAVNVYGKSNGNKIKSWAAEVGGMKKLKALVDALGE